MSNNNNNNNNNNIIIHKDETEFTTYASEIKSGVIFKFRNGKENWTWIKTSKNQIVSLENGITIGDYSHSEITVVNDKFTIEPNYKRR